MLLLMSVSSNVGGGPAGIAFTAMVRSALTFAAQSATTLEFTSA